MSTCLTKSGKAAQHENGAGLELDYDKLFKSAHGYSVRDGMLKRAESPLDTMDRDSSKILKHFLLDLMSMKDSK